MSDEKPSAFTDVELPATDTPGMGWGPVEPCASCKRVHGVDGYFPQHPYRRPGDPVGSFKPDKEPEVRGRGMVGPFDPVLRQALIDKGVLTPDDLRAAEEKIAAVTGAFQASMGPDTIVSSGPANRGGVDE